MTSVVKVGTEFGVNTQTAGGQWYPTVTGLTNGGFVVTWQDGLAGNNGSGSGTLGDNSFSSIKAQVYTANGTPVGGEFLVNTQTTGGQASPTITALTTGGFVVSWQDLNSNSGDIRAQIYNADGTPSGSELSINTVTSGNQNTPTITALPNGGFVVAWTDQSGSTGGDIKAQMFDTAGLKVGAEFRANSASPYEQERASVSTLSNGDFVVTWNDFRSGNWEVRGQVFHPTSSGATRVGSEFVVDNAFYNNRMTASVTGLSNGNFVVSYEDTNGEVRAQLYAADGIKIGSSFVVNTNTGGNQGFPSITSLSTGGFVVTWSDEGSPSDGSASSIKAQVYDANGVKVGGEYLINSQPNSNQLYPSVTGLANGGFVVTWQDFSMAVGDTVAYGIAAQVFGIAAAPNAPTIVSITDDVGPVVGVVADGSSTNDTNLTVRIATGSYFAGDTIQLFDGTTAIGSPVVLTVANVAAGFISIQTGVLTNSTHAITAKVTDATGAQSAAATAINVTVDTIAPAVAVTGVTLDTDNLPVVTVHGTAGAAEAGRTVSVFDGANLVGTATVGADGSWSLPGVTLVEGANNLTAQVTDAAGNTGTSVAFAAPTVVSTGETTVAAATVTAMGYIVLGSGVLDIVSGGNVSAQITIGTGGVVNVETGATASNAVIAGGTLYDYGSTSGTTVGAGGVQHVYHGGSASDTTVAAGGYQDVWNGTVTDTSLSGSQQVLDGGLAIRTVIGNGGYEYVGEGGATQGTIVNSGGFQYVDAGAIAEDTVVAGGYQYVGGVATGGTVTGGTTEGGGVASGTVVESGGAQHVYQGGTATNSTIAAGAFQDVYNATVLDSIISGHQQVLDGGLAIDTVIASGGNAYVGSGGTTDGTVVYSGGMQYLDSRAVSNATIVNGGFEYVGGIAHESVVNNGGVELVGIGGIAHDAVVNSGGSQRIAQGGTATGATVNAGGSQFVDIGGRATGTLVDGGYQYVAGIANGSTVDGGGRIEVASGGVANDTHLADGVEYVYAGGTVDDVDFSGEAASLYLDDASGLTGTVSNFEHGDTIGLLNTSVTSFDFDGTTLTLNTGSGSVAYQFANVQDGTEFSVASDGHGGTLIGLSLLTQFSASLVPDAGADTTIVAQDAAAVETTLANIH